MDIAKQFAAIGLLCGREFPVEPGRPETGTGGPGCPAAGLLTSGDFREDTGSGREETEAQSEAERDGTDPACGSPRAGGQGPPQFQLISLYSVFERSTLGEDVDEPWASPSAHVTDTHVRHIRRAPAAGSPWAPPVGA
jgi:hypothetical protein